MEHRCAIVLAVFGTSVRKGLPGILNIFNKTVSAFPQTSVRLAFTSSFLRRKWHQRAGDEKYREENGDIPEMILNVYSPLAAIAAFQEEGFDSIIVQAIHLAPAEEYMDLVSLVKSLDSIQTVKKKTKPFKKLLVGRPAFGALACTEHSYSKDIVNTAKALKEDVELTRAQGGVLVYMGHGNKYIPTSGFYMEFEAAMNSLYPDISVFVGTMEGHPSFLDVLQTVKNAGVKKVLLKPLMVVAGIHAINDMIAPEPDSWKSQLEKAGITVVPVMRGLGEQNGFASLFVRHVQEAAEDAAVKCG